MRGFICPDCNVQEPFEHRCWRNDNEWDGTPPCACTFPGCFGDPARSAPSGVWGPPRCSHGNIILGCPQDDCPEQSAYLNAVREAADSYDEHRASDAWHMLTEFASAQAH